MTRSKIGGVTCSRKRASRKNGVCGSTAKRIEKDYGYLWDDVRRYVKESPGTAVAISVGIGFLLGYLLSGGDDD